MPKHHFQRARNAVVAGTLSIAELYMEAFDLSPEDWKACGMGESANGRQFDRVVLLRPHWGSGGTHQLVEQAIEQWRCRLSAGGKFQMI